MKFLGVLVLFALFAYAVGAVISCSDPDGSDPARAGSDILRKTTVTGSYQGGLRTLTDRCVNDGTVLEMVCEKGVPTGKQWACGAGLVCSNGACVKPACQVALTKADSVGDVVVGGIVHFNVTTTNYDNPRDLTYHSLPNDGKASRYDSWAAPSNGIAFRHPRLRAKSCANAA